MKNLTIWNVKDGVAVIFDGSRPGGRVHLVLVTLLILVLTGCGTSNHIQVARFSYGVRGYQGLYWSNYVENGRRMEFVGKYVQRGTKYFLENELGEISYTADWINDRQELVPGSKIVAHELFDRSYMESKGFTLDPIRSPTLLVVLSSVRYEELKRVASTEPQNIKLMVFLSKMEELNNSDYGGRVVLREYLDGKLTVV